MVQKLELFKGDKLKEGEMQKVAIRGKEILVARIRGRFYAIGNKCTHMGCSLSEGTLEGDVITCPCHGTKFDITSGHVLAWVSRYPLIGKLTSFMKKDEPVYEVLTEDDSVIISIAFGY